MLESSATIETTNHRAREEVVSQEYYGISGFGLKAKHAVEPNEVILRESFARYADTLALA